jgi:hypothetical protein
VAGRKFEEMGRRQPSDPAIHRPLCLIDEVLQVESDLHLVDLAGNLGNAEKRLDLRSEGEKASGKMIIKRSHPHRVPGAEESPTAMIPDREGEIPDQPFWRPPPPCLVGSEDQVRIADFLCSRPETELLEEFATIVYADVRHDDDGIVAIPCHTRLDLVRDACRVEGEAGEADGT